jgi:hypothetical protein
MAFIDVALAVGTFVGADALGATAATMVGGALIGGGIGAGYSALTGDGNIGQSALIGGALGGAGAGIGAAMAAPAAGGTIATAPVAGTLATPAVPAAVGGGAGAAGDVFAGYSASGSAAGTAGTTVGAAGGSGAAAGAGAGGAGAAGSMLSKAAPWMLGTAGLGYLMQQDNKKYGTPATQTYDGPLNDFHYSRENYTPYTASPPSPAYQPAYANYVKNPYNPYAAKGGHVVSMAGGGIANASRCSKIMGLRKTKYTHSLLLIVMLFQMQPMFR